MPDLEKLIQGIQECNLNGGRVGNCPYKGIIDLLKEQDAGSVGIRQTSDSIEFTASGDAQHGYEIGIVIGKMTMLDYIWKSCMNRNMMTDGVLDILKMARKKI